VGWFEKRLRMIDWKEESKEQLEEFLSERKRKNKRKEKIKSSHCFQNVYMSGEN